MFLTEDVSALIQLFNSFARPTFQYSTTIENSMSEFIGICGANEKAPPEWGL